MKTEWDYTPLADAYLKRPDYSDDAIRQMLQAAAIPQGGLVCDVGAGVAHLTLKLAQFGFRVVAIEPNDAMRANGMRRTERLAGVEWHEGTAERTGQPDKRFDLVTFGSSFNVTDRPKALAESARILRRSGWFACMWNHRDLSDPIQSAIESAIRRRIPGYDYGSRREDQTDVIMASGLTSKVKQIEGVIQHRQSVIDCMEAWRSHATLQRQAGDRFALVLSDIEKVLDDTKRQDLIVPYTTRIWLAQFDLAS